MPKFTRQMTVAQFEKLFPNDDACKSYLVASRWPQGVRCPRCDNADVYPVANKPFHWQCSRCAKAGGYRFSVLVGSIFENTKVGMRIWFRVVHMTLTAKKGVSSLQVHRTIGFGSYATALYMCHRIEPVSPTQTFASLWASSRLTKPTSEEKRKTNMPRSASISEPAALGNSPSSALPSAREALSLASLSGQIGAIIIGTTPTSSGRP